MKNTITFGFLAIFSLLIVSCTTDEYDQQIQNSTKKELVSNPNITKKVVNSIAVDSVSIDVSITAPVAVGVTLSLTGDAETEGTPNNPKDK